MPITFQDGVTIEITCDVCEEPITDHRFRICFHPRHTPFYVHARFGDECFLPVEFWSSQSPREFFRDMYETYFGRFEADEEEQDWTIATLDDYYERMYGEKND